MISCKKTYLKKIIFILSILFGILVGMACADGGEWFEEQDSSFSSSYFIPSSLSPFFKMPNSYLESPEIHNSRFDSIIIAEWHYYFNSKINKKDLEKTILATSENEVNLLYNALKEGKELPKHSWLSKVEKPKAINFLKYLANAKHAEQYARAISNEWGYENNKFKFKGQPEFEKQLIILLN